MAAAALPGSKISQAQHDEVGALVKRLIDPQKREIVLQQLSKKRETFPYLAPMLWHSVGTIAVLLQEIIAIYPALSPPTLDNAASSRVCNALALLQCVAGHPETRKEFLKAQIPLYLYPFLSTKSSAKPFEFLKLTSLGVIGALVKQDDPQVVEFLLSTEIIPLSLRIMEVGTDLSRTVATFIVQKILQDDNGLQYICATFDRFTAVSSALGVMVKHQKSNPSMRLLKHAVRCYQRLTDNENARTALKTTLPSELKDNTFAESLKRDEMLASWVAKLRQL